MIRLIGGSLVSSMLIASGVYFFKQASLRALAVWSEGGNALATVLALTERGDFWIGLCAYAIAFAVVLMVLPYVRVHQFFPLALVCNLVLTAAVSMLFLGESIPMHRFAGLALIILGGFLVSK